MSSPLPPSPSANGQQPMHPQDKKNLLIFVLVSVLLWLAFDHFVLAPRADAARKAQEQALQAAPQTGIAQETAPLKNMTRAERLALSKRVPIDAPELVGSISLTGGRIDDLSLRHFYQDLKDSTSVVLLSPSGEKGAHFFQSGWLGADTAADLPTEETVWSVAGETTKLTPQTPVTLTWTNSKGVKFERTYKIDDHFMFEISQKIDNSSSTALSVYPYAALTRTGVPEGFSESIGYEGPLGYIADKMEEIAYDDLEEERTKNFTALTGWIGFGEKYWLSAIVPSQTTEHSYSFQSVPGEKDKNNAVYQLDARGTNINLAPNQSAQDSVHVFVGAKKLSVLSAYGDSLGIKHFDFAIDFGILYFLTKPLYQTLIFLNGLVGNFGIAIILLTFAVRALVFPLANKSYRSFAALRKISPKMAEIKARYGNDKPRLQQELVKLYETERVNPMAGCFPLLLQIPIFFAVYKVITIAVEMRHAPFFGWIHDLSAIDTLSVFNMFGLLPYDVPAFMHIGPWSLAMLAMLLFQKHLNPPPQDQIQRDIANYMPWIMTYMLSRFASGLVIYWAFSNLLSVIQQAIIMRSMGVPIYLFSPDEARAHHESHKEETQKVLDAVRREKEEVKDDV